jgi:hypothetical protein
MVGTAAREQDNAVHGNQQAGCLVRGKKKQKE